MSCKIGLRASSREICDCVSSLHIACNGHAYLHLGVGPSRDFDNHVVDTLVLVGKQRNVVKGRDGLAVLQDEEAVVERVGSSHCVQPKLRNHVCYVEIIELKSVERD